MVRKMAYVGFSYLLGLLFASFFYFNLNIAVGIVLIVLAVVFGLITKGKKISVCLCFVCFAVGAIFYSCYENAVYNNTANYAGNVVEVRGVITDSKDFSNDISSYTVDGKINGVLSAEIICYGEAKNCEIGDEIYVKGKTSLPKNTYMFNSLDYYKAKGIYLTIGSADEIVITPADKLPLKRILCRYRDYIYDRMNKYLSSEEMPVAKAMIFGDKSGIDDTTKTLLYRAGIGHIMAVSGVHLSVVCSLFWFILCLFQMNKYVRFGVLLVPMGAFVMLSGASDSVIRAAVMLILVYGANLFNRRADLMNSLGIAVIILTVGCPFSVRDASFLLSVVGVIGIGAVAPEIIKLADKKQKFRKHTKSLIASVCVSAIVFPVSFLFFDEISIISPVSNLILLPFCTLILISGVISALFGGVSFVMAPMMKICGVCCKIVLVLSKTAGSFQFAYIPLGYKFTGATIIIAIIVIIAAALYFRKAGHTAVTAVAVFTVCIAVIAVYRFIPSDHISVAVLNNGKGSSSLVIHDNKNASVIDLIKGGRTADCAAKYLNRAGINRVELLGLTVDGITSETMYMNSFELFRVGTALAPESTYKQPYNYSCAERTQTYDNTKTCTVSMPDYTLTLSENNTMLIEINGFRILTYNGKYSTAPEGYYDAVIVYAGTEINENINGGTVIFIDSGAEAAVNKDTAAYIGENILIEIYSDKIESEVIHGGSSY